ncbi:putative Hydroxyproline-rich glycoprotein family protein [Hibiscus syriacus]|uniref:Hydroxyproline-rich glycoprotein family protein n=1 Tax=Hibiscus syriacus TaxID=106335 RepID=A0A6A3BY00_HIBSY|nr:putative Hydroxyproline-rich glycoprotein family protein [Hibiscus syriacus]
MAFNHFPSFLALTLLIVLLSFGAHTSLVKARNLQEIPKLPKPELPSFPEIPTIPELPKLPPLPEIPTLPKPELPAIPTLPNDLPFPFFSPPHATTNP